MKWLGQRHYSISSRIFTGSQFNFLLLAWSDDEFPLLFMYIVTQNELIAFQWIRICEIYNLVHSTFIRFNDDRFEKTIEHSFQLLVHINSTIRRQSTFRFDYLFSINRQHSGWIVVCDEDSMYSMSPSSVQTWVWHESQWVPCAQFEFNEKKNQKA